MRDANKKGRPEGRPDFSAINLRSRTPRRRAASVALEARAIPHQREIRAFGAGLADVSLHPRFRSFVRGRVARAAMA